jgi:tetratricopeptide (TPR) repeat protein
MLLILLLAGCSAGMKNRWVDFNAYFNTYYNAQESYKRGYTLVQNQVVVFNPARPIKVHLTPARAGQSDFEKAIEKSANILREYPDSRWADDALELIGKSYFYLGQYYSAEQKFDEVLMASPNDDLRQQAILW